MRNLLTVGSLFAGIGGFDLGLERAGMRTVWQVEQDEFCQRVLARHFPGAQRFVDVRDVGADCLAPVDVICGGFPCQDLSVAGKRAGLDGERSGLWGEMLRIACELRPRYVLIENVSNLLYGDGGTWMRRVLGDLAASGFDAEWDCLPASAFGAPHRRDRIWIVAYPHGDQLREQSGRVGGPSGPDTGVVADNGAEGQVADTGGEGLEGRFRAQTAREALSLAAASDGGSWKQGPAIPGVCGVGYGLPDWVDRIRSLGNALVPQIAEWIGRRIMEYESACQTAATAGATRTSATSTRS